MTPGPAVCTASELPRNRPVPMAPPIAIMASCRGVSWRESCSPFSMAPGVTHAPAGPDAPSARPAPSARRPACCTRGTRSAPRRAAPRPRCGAPRVSPPERCIVRPQHHQGPTLSAGVLDWIPRSRAPLQECLRQVVRPGRQRCPGRYPRAGPVPAVPERCWESPACLFRSAAPRVPRSRRWVSNAKTSRCENQLVISGRERFDQLPAHIQKRESRRSQQVFQGAGHEEVHVQRAHVDGARAAVLVAVQEHQRAVAMSDSRDGRHVGAEPVHEGHVGQRYDARPLVDGPLVRFRRHRVVHTGQKLNLCAPRPLRQPDVSHGRKLVFAHDHSIAAVEAQRVSNGIDSRRRAGHDGDFVPIGVDESRERGAQRLVNARPFGPGSDDVCQLSAYSRIPPSTASESAPCEQL